MVRDNKSKVTKENNKRNRRSEELSRRTKNNDNSDSNDSDWIESDSDMDSHEYRKFLSKLYPSKNLDKKIKAGEDLKRKLKNNKNKDDDNENSETDEESEPVKKNDKNKKNKKSKIISKKNRSKKEIVDSESSEEEEEVVKTKGKNNKKSKNDKSKSKNKKYDSETETEISLGSKDTDDSDLDEDEEDYESYDDEEEDEDSDSEYIDEDDYKTKGSNKFNIIFTIGGVDDEEEDEWETDDSDCSESDEITENEDESVSSVSSSESESKNKKSKLSKNKSKNVDKKNNKSENKENKIKQIENELLNIENKVIEPNNDENIKLLDKLKELHNTDKNNKTILKCIEVCQEELKVSKEKRVKKEKKQKEKNSRIFKKIIRDKNTMNDFAFFNKLEMEEQKKVIKELKEINKITRIEKPYRMSLLEADIPPLFKAAAMKKINSLRYMEPGSGEFYKIKNWVDTFMRIPFGTYRSLDISIDDGVEKCHEFMASAQQTLDKAVYGLNDAKMQIMQMLGQLVTNPSALGTAIAIQGPMGTGKTTLVKEGISKILNRPFAFIALGGATDSSFLEGHSYTYEGSTWGKIVQIIIDSNCMRDSTTVCNGFFKFGYRRTLG
jgi:hypothetical protein